VKYGATTRIMNRGVWEYRREKGRVNAVRYPGVCFRGMKRNTTNIREENNFCVVAKAGYHAGCNFDIVPQ
jgi:nucleoside-diphosphate-sugar epimerase